MNNGQNGWQAYFFLRYSDDTKKEKNNGHGLKNISCKQILNLNFHPKRKVNVNLTLRKVPNLSVNGLCSGTYKTLVIVFINSKQIEREMRYCQVQK